MDKHYKDYIQIGLNIMRYRKEQGADAGSAFRDGGLFAQSFAARGDRRL